MFLGKLIPRFVIMRLRIIYAGGRLRGLQDAKAESARTDCTIADDTLVGQIIDEGKNVNYNCKAKATMEMVQKLLML